MARSFSVWVVCCLLSLVFPITAQTQETKLMDAITENIRKVCQAPSDQGKYWSVDVSGEGKANVAMKLANFGMTGTAQFSEEEWKGVQKVLKEHQLDDNKSYRLCVQELTPKFLEKFGNPSK